jgi:Bacterial PH domain
MERFTISRRQVSGLGTYAGAIAGLGAVLLVVFALAGGWVARGALSLGSVSILGGLTNAYLALASTRAYTEISADGIRTENAFGTKHVAWPDIKDIKVDHAEKRTWHVIKIVCRNGRTFTLGAPLESRTFMPDPDFKAKLERIVAAWREMSVAAGN